MVRALIPVVGLLVGSAVYGTQLPIIEQLSRDLDGKAFIILRPVAARACVMDPKLGAATSRLVDTEVDGEGMISYYVRADRFMNLRRCPAQERWVGRPIDPAGAIEPPQISRMHPTGAQVTVKAVEGKEDRIEFFLQIENRPGDEGYGKIKLMLGHGYHTLSLEEVEVRLAQVLEMPRIRALLRARAELSSIEEEIAVTENKLSAAGARQRQASAERLIELYQKEMETDALFNTVAFQPAALPNNSAKAETMQKIAAEAARLAQKEEFESALRQYVSSVDEMKSSCEKLDGGPVGSRSEFDRQVAATAAVRREIGLFRSAGKQMVNLGQSIPSADEEVAARCSTRGAEITQGFPAKDDALHRSEIAQAKAEQQRRSARELADLDEEFHRMKGRQRELDGKLLTSFGGPGATEVLVDYRDLLGRMINNRRQAVALGSRNAVSQIDLMTQQLQKIGERQ